MSFLNTNKTTLAKILPGIDLIDILASKIIIQKVIYSIIKIQRASFRCFRCYRLGNLAEDCVLPFNKNCRVKKTTSTCTQNVQNHVGLDNLFRTGEEKVDTIVHDGKNVEKIVEEPDIERSEVNFST